MYDLYSPNKGIKGYQVMTMTMQSTKISIKEDIQTNDITGIEEKLIQQTFINANELANGDKIPCEPGIYCIKLRDNACLPAKYGQLREDRIIYIGKATTVLKKRLWEEELNNKRPATFFRSIGAMLGYLPPKGALVGKKNTKSYKFNSEDTKEIKEWIQNSLDVNFVSVIPTEIKNIETYLIQKYRPLVNIKDNPTPSAELKAARNRCMEWANSAE